MVEKRRFRGGFDPIDPVRETPLSERAPIFQPQACRQARRSGAALGICEAPRRIGVETSPPMKVNAINLRPGSAIEVDGKLFGQAVVERETAEQWRFVGQIHWSGPDPARVRAFLYQREAGRLLPLPGEMTLGADEDETQ